MHTATEAIEFTPRTDDEILQRIEEIKDRDVFGFERSDLIVRLPFEMAKPHLQPDVTAADWEPSPRDRESVITRMLDYMPFAWEKANNCRGLSASRSMSHYMAWLWLVRVDLGDLLHYQFYGKDNLRRICEHFGWDANQWDDGVREN